MPTLPGDSGKRHIAESANARNRDAPKDYDAPISLAPLSPGGAIAALLAIPEPGATKPKHIKKGDA